MCESACVLACVMGLSKQVPAPRLQQVSGGVHTHVGEGVGVRRGVLRRHTSQIYTTSLARVVLRLCCLAPVENAWNEVKTLTVPFQVWTH